MEIERDLVVQVGVTVAVVGAFVLALALVSTTYGDEVPVEDRPVNGTIDGTYGGEIQDGPVSLAFDGTYNNGVEAMLDGQINGTVENGTLTRGTLEGEISGAIDGTVSGTVTGAELDEDSLSIEGSFQGTANGTTANDLSDEGGLILLGLLAAFIVGMPLFGYLIKRLQTGDD